MSLTVQLLKADALEPITADLIAAVHDETVAAQQARDDAVQAKNTVFDTVSKAIVFVAEDATSLTFAYGSQVQIVDVTTPYGPGLSITFN